MMNLNANLRKSSDLQDKYFPNPFSSNSPSAGNDQWDHSKQPALYGQPTGAIDSSCSANLFAPLQDDDGFLGPTVVGQTELEIQTLNMNKIILVNTTGVDTLEAWKTGSTAKNIGHSTQVDSVTGRAKSEAISELQTNLDDGGLTNELQSTPVISQQNIGNLSKESAAPGSMVPLLKHVVGRNPKNVTHLPPCVAAPNLAPRPKDMDIVCVESDDPLSIQGTCTLSTPVVAVHQCSLLPQGGLGVDGPHSSCSYIASFARILKHSNNTNIPYCEASLLNQPISDVDRSEALGDLIVMRRLLALLHLALLPVPSRLCWCQSSLVCQLRIIILGVVLHAREIIEEGTSAPALDWAC